MRNRFKFRIKLIALMVFALGAFPMFGQGVQTLEDGSVIVPMFENNLIQLDPDGRLEGVLNSHGGLTTFTYDAAGNLIQRTDAGSQTTDYGYDPLNRLIAVTNQGIEVATFDHDGNGNLVELTFESAQSTFGYDSMNRLVASTQSVYSVSSVVQNQFDLNGNRTNIVYPGGLSVSYQYGADNRLESVTADYANNADVFTFSYDTANHLTGIAYPNGVNSTFGHDAKGRVTNIKHGNFVDRTIIRNALGFKQTELIDAGIKPTVPDTRRSIKTHNDADQLTSEWIQTPTSTQTVNYAYNDNGCLTNSVAPNSDSVSHTYDYDNRIISAVQNSLFDIRYLYDASGARIGRIAGVSPAVTNYFVIDYTDGLKRPLAETDASGTVIRFYVWAGARLLCHIEANGDVYYYHADELGSTLALTDEMGTVTDEFAYMPYGYANHTAHLGSSDTPFLWLGGSGVYYDSATDLHLTLHRAYSAKLKRFISADPLGIDGGVNVYAMANRNPLAFVDPYGLCADSIGGGLGQTYLSAARGSSIPWDRYEADQQMRSQRALADEPLLLGSSFTGYSDFGHGIAEQNAIDYVTAIPSAVVGEWAWGKTAGMFGRASKTTAYRAINPKFAQSTLDDGFYRSGAAGRLGNDGIYANSSIKGAVAEFQYHNPGVNPTVFEVNYPAGSTLNVNPPSGNFYIESPLPFTQDANVLVAPSLRQSGTMNYLIRRGATPGRIVQ